MYKLVYRFSPIVSLLCYNKCYQRSGIKPRQVHTGLGRSRARKYLEKPLLQLRIKKDDGSERVKVHLQRELNADEAILPEVNNVLERLRLDFDLFEPLRKMLELDVSFFALRGMPENTEYLYLHL